MAHAVDVFSSVVGVLSIVLAILAIGQASYIYTRTRQSESRIQEINKEISAEIKKLEEVYRLLYGDTWSLVRESYGKMQAQIFDSPAVMANQSEPRSPIEVGKVGPETTKGDAQDASDLFSAMSASKTAVTVEDVVNGLMLRGYSSERALNAVYNAVYEYPKLRLHSGSFRPGSRLDRVE